MSLDNKFPGSLAHYQQLQASTQSDKTLLGVTLPLLKKACLQVTRQTLNASEVMDQVIKFSATQGWIMYRDGIAVSSHAPENQFFIEGEWCKGASSIKVKLLGGEQYLFTQLEPAENAEAEQAYTEQHMNIRSSLKGDQQGANSTVLYRLWWQLETELEHEGRWLPLVQQFAGFHQEKETL